MTCPRCQHENRSGAKFCEECRDRLGEKDGPISSNRSIRAPRTNPHRRPRTPASRCDGHGEGRQRRPLSSSPGESRLLWVGAPAESSARGSRRPSRRSRTLARRRTARPYRHRRSADEPRGHAPSPGKDRRGQERDAARGSGREAASRRWNGNELAFTVSRKGEAGSDVLPCQIGKVAEDCILAHSGRQVLQDVGDRYP